MFNSFKGRKTMKKLPILITLSAFGSLILSGCGCSHTTPTYTVSFKNYDETLLSESTVKEGETAVYEGTTPTRAETSEFTYTFKGWDKSLENITSNCSRVAQFTETRKPVTNYYTVTFKNYDGNLLEEVQVVEGGTAIYSGLTPTRASTPTHTYTFAGWDLPLTNITSNSVRVAQFNETQTKFTVSFKNYDDTLLYETYVNKGDSVVYQGTTPTKPETNEYEYTFKGWDHPLTNITSDTIFVAQFNEIKKVIIPVYTVTFKNYDGSILEELNVEEGKSVTYTGPTPTRASTSEHSYTFTGWDLPLTNITSDSVRIAQYTETNIEYTVRFYNYDNSLLYTDTVYYKESASYYGDTPTKPSSSTHKYTFIGWDKDISCITKSIDVKATYVESGISKQITLKPNNGEADQVINVTYGEAYDLGTPFYTGFTFLGWFKDETNIVPTSGTWTYSDVSVLTAKWGDGYFAFTLNDDNASYKVELTDLGKAATEIVIPSIYNELPVTSLGTDFARNNTKLTKVTIPGTIKEIPNYAFYSNTNLKEVTLNEGLLTIGNHSFRYSALEKIIIPSTVTSIGDFAFDGSSALYHIYIPSSVNSMGTYAFDAINSAAYICIEHDSIPTGWPTNWRTASTYVQSVKLVEGEDYNYVIKSNYGDLSVYVLRLNNELSKLQTYTFPTEIEGINDIRVGKVLFNNNKYIRNIDLTGVTIIGASAFASCSNLETVKLSNSLTTINESAFNSCSSLTNITFPNSLITIGSNAFRYCTSLTRVEIPESVTEIQSLAFDACSNLTYIYIPKTVTTIGAYAFDDCNKSIIYTNAHSNNAGWASNYKGSQPIFYDYVSNGDLDDFNYVVQSYMGDSYVTISGLKDSAKTKKNIVIPDEIEGISDIRLKSSLFVGFTELVSIDLGSGVTKVPELCFRDCTKLETVIMHDVTSIGNNAFYNCNKLTSLVLPDSLSTIGNSAFDYCSSLGQVIIPISVTSIGSYAFDDTGRCVFLIESNINQPGWASNWYGSYTSSKTFIYSVVSTGVVGDFRYAKTDDGLTETIYIIGLTKESTNLDLVIPNEIEGITNIKIASYAFDGNTLIKSIDLGNSVNQINGYAFRGNTSLRSVIIPLNCSVIRNYAFQNCSKDCVISCEVDAKPEGWESSWNPTPCQVVWNYTR